MINLVSIKGKPCSLIRTGLFLFLAMVFTAGHAVSATYTSTANVNVSVNSVFTLTIDTTYMTNVDFGNLEPGYFKEVPSSAGYANAIICKSNTGKAWYLQIKADGPLTSGAGSLAVGALKWLAVYAGSKNAPYTSLSSNLAVNPLSGYQDFTTVDTRVYNASSADYNNMPNGTEIQFKYGLQLPVAPAPQAGSYTTTVTYTMTE